MLEGDFEVLRGEDVFDALDVEDFFGSGDFEFEESSVGQLLARDEDEVVLDGLVDVAVACDAPPSPSSSPKTA